MFLKTPNNEIIRIVFLNSYQRNFRISKVEKLIESGEATRDDYWDAVFPSIHWCEYELENLDFHTDYDTLYEIAKSDNTGVDKEEGLQLSHDALEYRTTNIHTEALSDSEAVKVIMALCYRQRF